MINLFVKYLSNIHQYKKADISRNQMAAVLNLSSYDWSFDIVPGFKTTPEADGTDYYLIPDGKGHWMKTNPIIDQVRITSINQKHKGNILNPLRLLKYWNKRTTMQSIDSYLMECIVLDHYEKRRELALDFVDIEIIYLLEHLSNAILLDVFDPKGIQGNLNLLSPETRGSIAWRAAYDFSRSRTAREAENNGDHRKAISIWRDIFGQSFPEYTN